MRMAQSVAFAVQNVGLLAAGLASDSAARSEARRRLQLKLCWPSIGVCNPGRKTT